MIRLPGTSTVSEKSPMLPRRQRRSFLGRIGGLSAWIAGLVAGVIPASPARADRNVAAFDAKAIDDALAAAGVLDATESEAVILRAPDIAENSALVHVEIESRLPDTSSILLFAERNPQPFVAQFNFLYGAEPFVAVRIKMAESAHLRAVVRAGDGVYFARRETKVTLGGCAG